MRSPMFRTAVFPATVLAFALLTPHFLLAQYDINTIAGGGPNGLAALSSSIGFPGNIAFDSAGNAYIADIYSSRILEVSATGTVTVVAGNGTHGYSGDGGLATSATLDGPEGVAVDSSGNIFIADTGNSLIREVTASNGMIQTVAGSFTLGAGYSGDGGPATSAQLNFPTGIFLDSAGDIFIADAMNSAIREVVGSTINTVAGNGTYCADPTTACGDGGPATSAQLDFPEGVFVDASGNIYIADTDTARIRVVNPGTAPVTIAGISVGATDIATIAGAYYQSNGGTSCGPYTSQVTPLSVELCAPSGVFVDSSGDVFIADSFNSVIWELAASGSTITAVAGNGTAGYSGDTGAAASAELDTPNNVYVDSAGDIFIADTNNYVIREVDASSGNISTAIGNNTAADSGDGSAAVDAQLNYPGGMFVDGTGNIFIADSLSSVIREVSPTSGNIQTVAGDVATVCATSTATCGDGGPALSAQFFSPYGVATDAAGNIYIADTGDNRIRAVNTGSATVTIAGVAIAAGNVATIAGTGNECTLGSWPCGDSGPATSALLFEPFGVAVDSTGNIFVADTDDHAIRAINGGTQAITLAGVTIQPGNIATVAGIGTQCPAPTDGPCGDGGPATSAQLNFPGGLFVDSSDNIYIADTGNNRIRVVNTGTSSETIAGVLVGAGQIATVAGTGVEGYAGDTAPATSAQLAAPNGVFVDGSGNIFISDTDNFVIREVVQGSATSGSWDIATVAGNNSIGFSGDGGSSTNAQLDLAFSLYGDSNSNLYIADTNNSRIRELVPGATTPSATPPPAQSTSPGGSATYDIKLTAGTGNPKYAIALSCLQSSLPSGASCSFSPGQITPGPLAVPFTLTVMVPTSAASLQKPGSMRLQLLFAFVPLAGILFAGAGFRKPRRWLLLAALALVLGLLSACGGGSSQTSTGTNYTVQVQGTWTTQLTPVTITTASLTVQ